MNYIGIDVGANKYFLVHINGNSMKIEKAKFTKPDEICEFIKNNNLNSRNTIIAIDAPLSIAQNGHAGRHCERELGIYGYYQTPNSYEQMHQWMRSGIDLMKVLKERCGFRIISNSQKGSILEVHPTLIIKRLCSPQLKSNQWINASFPQNKGRAKGRLERRKILSELYPNNETALKSMTIDHLDGLIAAYAAQKYMNSRSNIKQSEIDLFGDPNEGQIYIPYDRNDEKKNIEIFTYTVWFKSK